MMNLPEKIKNIWSVLESAGHPTFLVGGAVRDHFLGYEPHDFDLATKARPEEIISLAKKHFPGADINFVGATFGVVLIDGIEIATFRGDCFNGSPWGEKENERLYFALSEIDYGNFKVSP